MFHAKNFLEFHKKKQKKLKKYASDTKTRLSWIEKKEQKWPGLYETYANWGTVLLFKGEWEQGLVLTFNFGKSPSDVIVIARFILSILDFTFAVLDSPIVELGRVAQKITRDQFASLWHFL
jgi:hypothetical protein